METTSYVSTFHQRGWSEEEEEHGRLPKRMRHDDAHEYQAIFPPPPPVPSSRKRGRLSVDEEDKEAEEPYASKRLRCESAEAAARSERTAQLLLRFSDTIERAKHKMDDGSTRVSPAAGGGGGSSSSRTRAHKTPDEQLQVEVEEMPIKCRLTPETRHRMLNAVLSKISSDSLFKRNLFHHRFSLQQD